MPLWKVALLSFAALVTMALLLDAIGIQFIINGVTPVAGEIMKAG